MRLVGLRPEEPPVLAASSSRGEDQPIAAREVDRYPAAIIGSHSLDDKVLSLVHEGAGRRVIATQEGAELPVLQVLVPLVMPTVPIDLLARIRRLPQVGAPSED